MLRFAPLTLIWALAACDPLALEPTDAAAGDAAEPDASAPDPGPARALLVLPREGTEAGFFDLPFPNDVRRTASGTTDFSGFPNPRRNSFVRRYVDVMTERLDGFGTNGAVYFRFSAPVDPASLDDATVRLVDVDPDSPDVGTQHPAVIHYQDAATPTPRATTRGRARSTWCSSGA